MNKKALVLGISGQDGAYLAQLLLRKGYEVYGGSRDAGARRFDNLVRLGIRDNIQLLSINLTDFHSVVTALERIQPDEIYNLAGQSSVGLSFEQPVEAIESITLACLNLLEGIRLLDLPVRLYYAASSECFGDTGGQAASETTPFSPTSPYAVAKCSAYWLVENYRRAYGLYACSGLLFNHESPLRLERFVTRKIVSAAVRIASGSTEKLVLGNTAICRDWGWAPEYVDAMWRMLQQDAARDFVIATGSTHSLETFIELAFDYVGLRWRDHVTVDATYARPADITHSCGDASAAFAELGWQAETDIEGIVTRMVDAERAPLDK